MPDQAILLIKAIPVLAACGIFLRIVGKETRRREKHLEIRLHEEAEALRRKLESGAHHLPPIPIVLKPIDVDAELRSAGTEAA